MSRLSEKEAEIRAIKTLRGLFCPLCITERGLEEIRKFLTELEKERCALAGEPYVSDDIVKVKLKPKRK